MNFIQNVFSIQVLSGKGKTKNVYRIQTVWSNNDFIITILDGLNAFRSNVLENKLISLANKYETEFEQYIKDIKLTLCQPIAKDFSYNRKDNTFLISRQQENFSVQFADFDLETIDFNVATISFIDNLSTSNDEFQNQLLIYKKGTEDAVKERDIYVEKLEMFVQEKKKMETELYSKFILLLNEKKFRIQYLTELLQKFKGVNGQYNEESIETEVKKKMNDLKNKETVSDSESDSENEGTTHEVQVQIETNSKKKIDFFSDDDDENQPTLNVLPKRIKISNNAENNNKINGNANKSNKEKPNLDSITEIETQQDVLEFNTQDLFDRL